MTQHPSELKQVLGDAAALIRAQLADDQRGAALMLQNYPTEQILALTAATSAVAAAVLYMISDMSGGDPTGSISTFLEGLDAIE